MLVVSCRTPLRFATTLECGLRSMKSNNSKDNLKAYPVMIICPGYIVTWTRSYHST